MHLIKRARIEAEDEIKKIVEGSNKGGITSAIDNNGEYMALDNYCVLNEFHLRTNNILSSNSLETEGDLPHGQMSSCLYHDFNLEQLLGLGQRLVVGNRSFINFDR